jgi:hypothetical protein
MEVLRIVGIAVLAMASALLWRAYVLAQLWAWFFVPLGWGTLSLPTALMAFFAVWLFKVDVKREDPFNAGTSDKTKTRAMLIEFYARPAFYLMLGFVVKSIAG